MAGTPAKAERRERCAALMNEAEFWDDVFEMMGQGGALSSYCAALDIPYSTVWHRISEDPELSLRYEQARKRRALNSADKIETLVEKVERGELDPKAGQVAIEGRQWLAARLDPHIFGEKKHETRDVRFIDMTKAHLDEVRRISRAASAQLRHGRQDALPILDADVVVIRPEPVPASTTGA